MIMLYFSGTGNSKYIAELFCSQLNSECRSYSIEEKIDFGHLMTSEKIIGFCYPIYGSRVPRIMREFVINHMPFLKGKKIIIFCTQLIFSGDGARVFTDIFPRNFIEEVIYAEHFFMPNNVCNLFLLPLADEKKIESYKTKAKRKMQSVCRNITSGIIKKRGFNVVSRLMGLIQGIFMPTFEKNALKFPLIGSDCTKCRLCASVCPMNNLEYENEKIVHKNNCTICYRCINKCPQKTIMIFFNKKVKKQYKGL